MEFTDRAYLDLLRRLRAGGYEFTDYFSWQSAKQPVILRHDVDYSLDWTLELSRLEAECGAFSTWFVLLKTDFYNPFTESNRSKLHALLQNGGSIGLHFDESQYASQLSPLLARDHEQTYRDRLCALIRQEAVLLSELSGQPVRSVSMHCPSPALLDRDLEIPGMVNSYGKTFFKEFKYLSDSMMRWREDVDGIIAQQSYPRLHILTHAFWYRDEPGAMRDKLMQLCRDASRERYAGLSRDYVNLNEIFTLEELERSYDADATPVR